MEPKEVLDELKTMLVARLRFEPGRVADVGFDTPLAKGVDGSLGLDSLDFIELGLAIEERYGIVIDESGLILTNYHVIKDATKVFVRLPGDKSGYADIHAADPRSDLAVLKVLEAPVAAVVAIDRSDALLSDLRILAGLTQPELAAAAGIPTSTLAALERGHRPLSESSAGALAVALGATGDDVQAAYERTRTQPPRTTRF